MIATEDRLLLTIEQSAFALGISRRKLEYLVTDGQLPTVHIGRSVRVPVASLRGYIERLQAEEGQSA